MSRKQAQVANVILLLFNNTICGNAAQWSGIITRGRGSKGKQYIIDRIAVQNSIELLPTLTRWINPDISTNPTRNNHKDR